MIPGPHRTEAYLTDMHSAVWRCLTLECSETAEHLIVGTLDDAQAAAVAHVEATDPTTPTSEPDGLAREIVALTILGEKIKEALDARRAKVAAWSQGSKQTIMLPNPENPNRPVKLAEVRVDGGQTLASISDRAAWLEWVTAESPQNIATIAASRTAWRLDDDSRAALISGVHTWQRVSTAAASAELARQRAGVWADAVPVPPDPEHELLNVIEDAGYTLTKVEVVPAETFVREAYEQETLRMSQKAGEPVTPEGLIPAGLSVSTAPGKPYVKVEKDQHLRAEWISAERARLRELPGYSHARNG